MKLSIKRSDLKHGLRVEDSTGLPGTVMDCVDPHNVHVLFDGDLMDVPVNGRMIACGGSGYYCFVKGCDENSEDEDPLYLQP